MATILYPYPLVEHPAITELLGSGHDVVVADEPLTDQELYDQILGCDALLLHGSYDPSFGFMVGIAMAMGKMVYVVDILRSEHFRFAGYLECPLLDEAVKALITDFKESEDDARLDRDELQSGGDPEVGGDSNS